MRLHRLDLTAFGPFAAAQSVDFDELSAAGLFLLHGATGAGKTSVLDGVCYALYGQVPGARPVTRLRSDHAAPGTATEVVLELTVGGRRLEITRRPEQPRAKKRGTGTTMDKAVTRLREYADGGWRGLSTSHQEIGEEIRQLVGMSCEQFCQVVLLPQGEFATFLRAGAVERAALLGRLFDTRRFKAVEQGLRERRQEAAQRLAAGDDALRQLAARTAQAAGAAADAGPEDGEPDDAVRLLTQAALARCDARETYGIAWAAARRAEEGYRAAAEATTTARDLHALQRRRGDALDRAAALALEEPARTAVRTRLTRAQAALTVEPALALRDRAARHHGEAVTARGTALAALAEDDEPSARTAALPHARAERRSPVGAPDRDKPFHRPAGSADPSPYAHAQRPGDVPAADTGESRLPSAGSSDSRSDEGERPASAKGLAPDGSTASRARRPSEGAPAVSPVEPRVPAPGSSASHSDSGERPAPAGGLATDGGPGVLAQRQGDGTPAADTDVPRVPAPGSPDSCSHGGEPADTSTESNSQAPDAGELARRAGRMREELGGLAAAEAAEAELREVKQRLAALEGEERDDEEAVGEAEAWLEGWPAARRGLQQRVDGGGEAAARAAGLAGQVEAARDRRDAGLRRDRLAEGFTRAQDDVRDARDLMAAAREAWQDLREARITGIAAELAAELTDGEPCRVCGAAEHPDPARPADRQVTRTDEDAAFTVYQRRQSGYETARDEATRLAAALDAATAVCGDKPLAQLTDECAALVREHDEAARAAAGVTEARRALALAEEERDRRAAQRQDALGRGAARASRREELDERQERLSTELARARAGHASVRARRARLAERVAVLDRAVQAVRAAADSARRLDEAEQALARAAATAGFASPDAAAAALLPPGRLRDAEQRTESWAREEAAIDAELAAPEPAAAAELPSADPSAAQREQEAAHRRLRDAASAESAAEDRCRQLDLLGRQAAARVRELAPERAEFARLKRLSELVSGTSVENRYRMELETYVLAARLEQVAAAAGVRLQRMSAGRYTLVHSDARGGGRSRSGLGLRVVDAWTGTERDTSTLSGGETFFASLALALGLADVVTDEAGGTRLDTLFIDEGFGSLDDQTLDEVLDVLDGLRERDRAVGIVSHVADLRHRIPAQLRVVKGRDGSSLRMRTGAAPRD